MRILAGASRSTTMSLWLRRATGALLQNEESLDTEGVRIHKYLPRPDGTGLCVLISVVTEQSEIGLVALSSINRSMLGGRDQALLDAALAVAREVRRPPMLARAADAKPEANAGEPEQGKPSEAAGSGRIAHVEDVIAGVDKLLSEAVR